MILKDGFLHVPIGPGLGMDLNEAAIRKYTIKI
jgi:L-alanine-DL-glutamate epimerase-like enolase superfamily enzyme